MILQFLKHKLVMCMLKYSNLVISMKKLRKPAPKNKGKKKKRRKEKRERERKRMILNPNEIYLRSLVVQSLSENK